ncbi:MULTISPECIES: 2OG-Fe(II) oxygenase [unclassified Brevundimonas]|uniref:2OG-Fe(II) oxygenase n=1 Tax=unclassified Brevundimonas TaxID=2622653 RepID=UPI0025C05563|nr:MULTISPECIES: 2OG-Fe(II) oxygenase family protein [unclassified Brevundimonas]
MSDGLNLAVDEVEFAVAAERLARTGRTRVPGLLGEGAGRLHDEMADPIHDWARAFHNPFGVDVSAAGFDAQSDEDRQAALDRIHAGAAKGLQFLFDRLLIHTTGDEASHTPPLLKAAVELFNSEAYLAFARRLTGDDRIVSADGQATRYLSGHFLNRHTDANEASGRLYAYVLNLSPRWRAEWGGHLQFLDETGEVTESMIPAFGALNVFKVPQSHAVSVVAPFAPAPRYSIIGWWRSQALT